MSQISTRASLYCQTCTSICVSQRYSNSKYFFSSIASLVIFLHISIHHYITHRFYCYICCLSTSFHRFGLQNKLNKYQCIRIGIFASTYECFNILNWSWNELNYRDKTVMLLHNFYTADY